VGYTATFSLPEANDAARQQLDRISGAGMQTVAAPNKAREGMLLYNCFIPAGAKSEALLNQLRTVPGIEGFSVTPMTTEVKESLLSQVSYKIFRTHIDATSLSAEELRARIEGQLRSSGINEVGVNIIQTDKGHKLVRLVPGGKGVDYHIKLNVDDGPNRTELVEEHRTSKAPALDAAAMTDAALRDYIRKDRGAHLKDGDIQISRSAEGVKVIIKPNNTEEDVLLFAPKN
jgi:hypothetical protein